MPNTENSITIELPKDTKKYWTNLISGSDKPVQGDVDMGTPASLAYAEYDDGTQVVIGITWDNNAQVGSPFGWVFNSKSNSYNGYPIDCSDMEDFYVNAMEFSVNNKNYMLNITEAS